MIAEALLVMVISCLAVGCLSVALSFALEGQVSPAFAKWGPRVVSGVILVLIWLVVGKVML